MCTQVTEVIRSNKMSGSLVSCEGRSVHLPADGLLLGQWHASALDLLLGDSRLVLGLWGGQVQRGGDYGFKL